MAGRLVNITDKLGEKGNSLELYKALDGKYYSSEAAYNNKVMMAEYRQNCISKMYELLSYDSYIKVPGVFWKWLNEVKPYGYDSVLLCIEKCADAITWAIRNKDFNTESNKMTYIIAILNNNITDALNETKLKCKQKQNQIDETLQINQIETIDLSAVGTTNKSKNITSLLGDI